MSFLKGSPWIATDEQCKIWGGKRENGERFRCYFCGHRFIPGDRVRCQYTSDIPGACGNPLVCEKCDGTKEEIVIKMKELYRKAREEMWWLCER